MAPLADMMNHNLVPKTKWHFDNETNSFVIQATEDIFKGEEIFITYGEKCNSSYFVDYGFVLPDNVRSTVPVMLKLSDSDPLLDLKKIVMSPSEDF